MKAVYDELSKAQPKQRFIVGIKDDVTFLSLDSDDDFSTEGDDVTRAVFFGLGSDGTVSANRSSVKIIGENTPMYSQGYFVYDSRKAGSITTSHVRFSPRPIKGSYLVHKANFVACHKFEFTERIDMLSMALPGATFLLNSPYGPDEVWDHLPCEMQKQIVEKKLKFYVVDAYKVAQRGRTGRPHQHRDADLLLQAGQRHSAGRGHRRDQGPGRRPRTARRAAARSSTATTRPSTWPWPACTKSRCWPRSVRSSTWCRPFRTMPRPSSRTCWA